MRQNLNLKAGELIVFSEGEYSDYGYRGQYVVLQDVTEREIREAEKEAKSKDYYDAIDRFIAICIRRGWLADINMREIYLGAYGELGIR